ncbi:MAG: hypothetical protein RL634_1558, partial [Bacteroidota bacterium]
MKKILFLLMLISTMLKAQQKTGTFFESNDIGNPFKKGSIMYNVNEQSYLITGGGSITSGNQEDFHFAHKKLTGDFILTADFSVEASSKNADKEFGWMIRTSLSNNSKQLSACQDHKGTIYMQWRKSTNEVIINPEQIIMFPKKNMQTIQLERKSNTYTMSVANFGEPLQVVGSIQLSELGEEVYAGLFSHSLNEKEASTIKVWNVRIDKPVPYTYHPNPIVQKTLSTKEPVFSCRLEIIDAFTGERNIIYEATHRFEAPNWMPDGKKLLFNDGGLLYKIPISGGALEKLNTDQVNKNNNDHGISFDGKMLAISSSRVEQKLNSSAVWVLPIEGGTPKLITKETPSYWHGWAPGNKEVVVVAQRNGSKVYNIYKVDIETGKEEDLTKNTTGH